MTEEKEQEIQTERPPVPNFLTKTRFDQFELPEPVMIGLDEAGYTFCTPIQAQVLPASLEGRDVAGQAQTGTGKTAAFLVTIFARLLAAEDRKAGLPSALVIAPTRELAMQIFDDAALIGGRTGLTLALAIGGIDYQKQADALRQGADIVICTPGRIIDYQKQGIFKTTGIKILVIDEADRLFDLGFIKDLRWLLRRLPHYDHRQSMLFSATLSYKVLELTYDYMNEPEFISVTPEDVAVEGIDQVLFHVSREEKLPLLLGLFEREEWSRVLIFVNTKAGVEWLAWKLQKNGLPAEGITGDLPQRKRLKLMEQFKDNQLKILVATDVASRGIHVEDISHVINYDLPQDPENYVHRIGRTARAGKTGKAFSLACEDYVFHLEPLEALLGYKIPVQWPEPDWYREDHATGRAPRSSSRASAGGRTSKPRSPRDRDYDRGRGAEGRPDRDRGRPAESRPDRERERPAESRPDRGPKPKTRVRTISRPGGIFGLAPGSRPIPAPVAEDQPAAPEKKKRRRRRKKKSPGGAETAPPNNGTENEQP
ncbi:MAG: DEAD/DEAH box helicase [Proteobacteria bacterium]|nr:DEAD/DEAH box helicase [Pseudomonadota bacterium]